MAKHIQRELGVDHSPGDSEHWKIDLATFAFIYVDNTELLAKSLYARSGAF